MGVGKARIHNHRTTQAADMNDHDAIDAINQVLDEWFRGDVGSVTALNQIASISGMNKISHEESE